MTQDARPDRYYDSEAIRAASERRRGAQPDRFEEMLREHGLNWARGVERDKLLRLLRSQAAEFEAEKKWRSTHRHYKGGLYRVVAEGRIESDLSPVIIYDNEAGEAWVRPYDDFHSLVDFDGGSVPRFTPLKDHADE